MTSGVESVARSLRYFFMVPAKRLAALPAAESNAVKYRPAPRKAYAVESKDIYADISSGGL